MNSRKTCLKTCGVILIALMPLILLLFAGCASDRSIQPPKGKTADELFKDGVSQLNQKSYREAIETFYQLKYEYPSETAAMLADLKIADAYYANEDYIEAINSYEDFRKMHPASPYIPYVVYMLGLSHYKMMLSIDRDQTNTELALNEFQYLLAHYPQTPYAWDSERKAQECMQKLSDHEVYVGDFYYRMKKYEAARQRYEAALTKYPSIPLEDKTLYKVADVYLQTDENEKARRTLAALIQQYPDSKYALKSADVMQEIPPASTASATAAADSEEGAHAQETSVSESKGATQTTVLSDVIEAARETTSLEKPPPEAAEGQLDMQRQTPEDPVSNEESQGSEEQLLVQDTALEISGPGEVGSSSTMSEPNDSGSSKIPGGDAQDGVTSSVAPEGLLDKENDVSEGESNGHNMISSEGRDSAAVELASGGERGPMEETGSHMTVAHAETGLLSSGAAQEEHASSRDSQAVSANDPPGAVPIAPNGEQALSPSESSTLPAQVAADSTPNETTEVMGKEESGSSNKQKGASQREAANPATGGEEQLGFAELRGDRPINITADRMDAFQRDNRVIFEGNVVVQQDDTYINAQKIEAEMAPEEAGGGIRQVVALKDVRIIKNDRVATCDRAEFDHVSRTIKLFGHPKVWQGSDHIDGDQVVVNLDQEKMTIYGSDEKQVSAVLYPKGKEGASEPPKGPEGTRASLTVPFAPVDQQAAPSEGAPPELAQADMEDKPAPPPEISTAAEPMPAPEEESSTPAELSKEEEAARVARAALEQEEPRVAEPQSSSSPPEAVEAFVERWRTAWESKSLESYMACYSKRFRAGERNWSAWRDYKAALNRKYKSIRVIVEGLEVMSGSAGVSAIFLQRYQADQYQDVGLKTLEIVNENGNWKIIREDWKPLPSKASRNQSYNTSPNDTSADRETMLAFLKSWRGGLTL